ncbi:protein maternal effect lethal 26-like [Chironomus tepperi]|uniref:protein maternal effect lethal 26-like n=1 Tax=Chironomus tepperi TaxID=113505 RepID=UPI00391F331C
MINQVKVDLDSSSEVLELHYRWSIPKYKIRHIYSEKLKLRDDIECTIMLVPYMEESKGKGYDNREFARSCFTVFFTKVPEDDNHKTFFSFDVRTHYKRHPVSTTSFKRVMMTIDGFRGQRNNLNSFVWQRFITREHSLELDVLFTLDDSSCKSFNLENFEKENSKLSQDYALLYKDPKFTDLMLNCGNNEEVPAHMALLAARSPVFAKILNNDENTHEIEDFNKEVVTEFLRFLYTDTISINEFDAHTTELLEMAKKYEVTELANLCQQDLVYGCKDKLDEIFNKFKNLSCQDFSVLNNFTEISRCVKDLYKATKIN